MILRCEVRCLHCGNDSLDVCGERSPSLDILARTHVWCSQCDRTFRLSLSMVRVSDEALAGVSGR